VPGTICLLLAPADLPDQPLRNGVNGPRNAYALFEEDLVILRDLRVQDRFRRGARPRIDRLIVVAGQNEVSSALTPAPDQRQLHAVEILRLVHHEHRRTMRRCGHVAYRDVDQIAEVEQTVG